MQDILFQYEMLPATWLYLSSLMTIGIFFKFHRFWSVRNLDLLGLIALAPGLLMIAHGLEPQSRHLETLGYAWLFVVGFGFLVRLLLDPLMVRRPLLEPNLNASGLTFTCVALFVFFMANVATNRAQLQDVRPTAQEARSGFRLEQVLAERDAATPARTQPPGFPWFRELAERSSRRVGPRSGRPEGEVHLEIFQATLVRTSAILGHLAVVVGMVLIGYRHFDNFHTGVAGATLYLLVFYTSQMTGRIDHVLPAALLIWAVAAYRRPLFAGALMGAAAGLVFYPAFLLPLWGSFYWRRGAVRFATGLAVTLGVMLILLLVSSTPFWMGLKGMLGLSSLSVDHADGFWRADLQAYRIPVVAAFLTLVFSLALWPAQKNLGTLLSCSAAVLLGVQFWQAHQGGLYMGWYLPMLVLTVFRPNLEDRVALTAVREGRWRR